MIYGKCQHEQSFVNNMLPNAKFDVVVATLRKVGNILHNWHVSWLMAIQKGNKEFSISVEEAPEIQNWLEFLCHNCAKLLTDLNIQDEMNKSMRIIYQKKDCLLSIMQKFVTKDCKLLNDDLGDDWELLDQESVIKDCQSSGDDWVVVEAND